MDAKLAAKWVRIYRRLNKPCAAYESQAAGILSIVPNNKITIYVAKNSNKFRIKSFLDWAWYTPSTLADAINNNTVEEYYEIMLKDFRSDPNEWKDTDLEMTLKSFYASRVNRCELT